MAGKVHTVFKMALCRLAAHFLSSETAVTQLASAAKNFSSIEITGRTNSLRRNGSQRRRIIFVFGG